MLVPSRRAAERPPAGRPGSALASGMQPSLQFAPATPRSSSWPPIRLRPPAAPQLRSRQRRRSPDLARAPPGPGEARPPSYLPRSALLPPLSAAGSSCYSGRRLRFYCSIIFVNLAILPWYCIFGMSFCYFACRSLIQFNLLISMLKPY